MELATTRGIGEHPNKQKPSDYAKTEIGRFYASECSLALLAGILGPVI